MQRQSHHPLEAGFSERIHTPGGVNLMELLRELEKDGYDVSGASAELVALVNYVTSSQISLADLSSHLDYCAEQIKKLTR